MRKIILLVVAVLASACCLLPRPAAAYQPGSDYYRSTDGSMVHRPTREPGSFGAVTAICGDGSRSFSHNYQGTCSHHGGVAEWK